MHKGLKQWMKSFLTLSKYEQRGIFVLLVLLLFLAGLNYFLPSIIHNREYSNEQFKAEVARFSDARKRLEDSLAIVKLQNNKQLTLTQAHKKLHPFHFDPNQLTQKQGLRLGLTLKQIKSIQHYLQKGGKFRKKKDFKKMYSLSKIEYKILFPYININPENKKATPSSPKKSNVPSLKRSLTYRNTEINTCDAGQLIQQLHLQPWLALRTIKYRNLLGNYYKKEQLKEVYGMNPHIYQKIKKYIICNNSKVKKIDINNASFKTLLHHPYIDYQTTRKLVNARKRLHGFRSLEEIKTEAGIPDSLYLKIQHYLYIRSFKN